MAKFLKTENGRDRKSRPKVARGLNRHGVIIGFALRLLLSRQALAGGGLNPAERLRLDRLERSGEFSVLSVDTPRDKRILERPSRPVAPSAPGLDRLIAHLEKTVRHLGGMGIAAVQVGIPIRLCLVRRRDGGERFQAFINPKIIRRSASRLASWENCLSVPWGYRYTYRPARIRVRFQTLQGETVTDTLIGEEAVIFQHETAHFDGRLLSHDYSEKWFIPPDEIEGFARQIGRECLGLGKIQCDAKMKQAWNSRAANSSPPASK